MQKFVINIGLFGSISIGKSTFLNAIAGQQYSDTEIKKTTMVPQIYLENEEFKSNAQIIRRLNREINESVMRLMDINKFSLKQCQPLYHFVDRICDLFDPNVIDDNLKINIYDIPGLNDPASKNIYFEWVRQNINLFDIVIFMTDISKGLNNSDELEIIHLLMESMKKYRFKMVCLMNKCDDLYFDKDQNDLVFGEKEQEDIFIHANNTLVDIAKMYDITSKDELFTPFFPISSENCFIYRALKMNPSYQLDQIHQNRLCKNECGPNQWKKMTDEEKEQMVKKIILNLDETYYDKIIDTGYIAVKNIIQNIIIQNKSKFILNHVEKKLLDYEKNTMDNITVFLKNINDYIAEILCIQKSGYQITYNNFWKYIKKMVTDYVNKINKIDHNILSNGCLVDFKKFENLHSDIQMACLNLKSLDETISMMPNYPKIFMENNCKKLTDKLLNIYDQLSNCSVQDYSHTRPTNLKSYLEIIKIFSPDHFENYALRFLDISCNRCSKHQTHYQKELFDLLIYIANRIDEKIEALYVLINIIILNKQVELGNSQSKQYFSYLIQIKKLVQYYRSYLPITMYTPLDILYEVTCKQISNYLNINHMINIFGSDMDYQKINNDLYYFYEKIPNSPDVSFENKLLEIYINKKLIKKNL